MPTISATATILNATVPAGAVLAFNWTVTLVFNGGSCAHAIGRTTRHPEIRQTTATNSLTIPFTLVRGGDLSVEVSAIVNGVALTAKSQNLKIIGTDPSLPGLVAAVGNAPDAFKRLMRLESGLRQFRSPACPLYSADNLGGVGLCQLTPPSNDDQIWSWKANVTRGRAFYGEKESIARGYARTVRNGPTFAAQVTAYNAVRSAANKPPVTITVPDYTAAELELDTIRAFNGYAGGLHEYRLARDAQGILTVALDPGERTGTAQWERISAADRIAEYDRLGIAANRRGDPNYVEDVLRQATF